MNNIDSTGKADAAVIQETASWILGLLALIDSATPFVEATLLVLVCVKGIYKTNTRDLVKEKVIAWVEAQIREKEFRDHSVYVLVDPSDGLIKYVGRTNNPKRREYEHQNDIAHPWRKDYRMEVLITGLTRKEAMVFEQILISAFTIDYLENARREIAANNISKYENYMDAISQIITGLPPSEIRDLINWR